MGKASSLGVEEQSSCALEDRSSGEAPLQDKSVTFLDPGWAQQAL